jgi:multicomponent Na+:H+ antiporter subunit G
VSGLIDIVSGVLILAGGALVLLAALGVVRMEDVFTRMHASTKAGSLGLGLIAAALLIADVQPSWGAKAAAVLIFMLTTLPIGAHLVGRAVYRHMDQREREACAPDATPEE